MSDGVRIETDENGVDWLVVEGILGITKSRLTPEEEPQNRFAFEDSFIWRWRFWADDTKLYGDMFTTPPP